MRKTCDKTNRRNYNDTKLKNCKPEPEWTEDDPHGNNIMEISL